MKKLMIVLAVMAVFGLAAAQAGYLGTATGLDSGNSYEVVSADYYASGGTAGNTVSTTLGYYDGNKWPADPANGLYRGDKLGNGSNNGNTGVFGIPGAMWDLGDGVGPYSHTPRASSLVLDTTVSGLAAAQYDVYVLVLSNNTNATTKFWKAGLNDSTPDVVVDDSTVEDRLVGGGGSLQWTIWAQYLGTTSSTTSFDVYITGASANYGSQGYVGVAYAEYVPPIAEPASLGLVGVAFLAMRKRRS